MYYAYSDYLKKKYGEKVYKLPVNLPLTCPNRLHGRSGCDFCAEAGAGFEAFSSSVPIKEQLAETQALIKKKYHAHKFIAYFQNYTNTFLPLADFKNYVKEAVSFPDIVELSISTRPDCIRRDYLLALQQICSEAGTRITIELGLQTANYHTLLQINRGHTLAEYIDAVLAVKEYGFDICTHVILNLPGDETADTVETAKLLSSLRIQTVKIHSLYIAKNTRLCEAFENGTISLCTKEEYLKRVILFLEYLSPQIAVERLFSRIPKEQTVFSNWGTSWWKLRDELFLEMKKTESFQGKKFSYLSGAALKYLEN